MRVRIFMLLAIIGAAGLAVLIDHFQQPNIEAAKPVPVFTLQTLDGNQRSITDFKGKTVLLNFWASWCIPCRAEMPELIKLAANSPQRFELILMSEDDTPQTAQQFIKGFFTARHLSTGLPNVTLAWDKDQRVGDLFKTDGYPETTVIGPDQTIQYKIIGALTDDDIRSLAQN